MEFTFVVQCHCGCETVDTIGVEAPSLDAAIAQMTEEWEVAERSVTIVAAFDGNPRVAEAPVLAR